MLKTSAVMPPLALGTQWWPTVLSPGSSGLGQYRSAESTAYNAKDNATCLELFMHWICWALDLARARAGKSMAAKMAMIAITTSNSIRVNPEREPWFPLGEREFFAQLFLSVLFIFRAVVAFAHNSLRPVATGN